MKIGFIGTGHMGGAIAIRLIDAGFSLSVFDKNPAVLTPLRDRGADIARSPREVADVAEITFACLPTLEISREVALGADGVAEGRSVQVHVETSTIGAPTVQAIGEELNARGIGMLDAPVSGGPRGAYAGTLTIISSGPDEVFDRVHPVLNSIARRVFRVGSQVGLAQVCKLVNNALSAIGMAAACEAIVTGVKAGLDAKTLIEVINASTGRNSATADKFPTSILSRTFDYGGPLEIAVKDMHLYLELAEKLGVPTWVANNAAALWQYAASQGGAKRDYTTLIQYLEEWAGVEVKGDGNGG